MTVCIDSCKSDDYYVSLEVKNNIYVVQVCPCFDDYRCGFPIREMTYHIKDKKNAYATFKRYKKRYC